MRKESKLWSIIKNWKQSLTDRGLKKRDIIYYYWNSRADTVWYQPFCVTTVNKKMIWFGRQKVFFEIFRFLKSRNYVCCNSLKMKKHPFDALIMIYSRYRFSGSAERELNGLSSECSADKYISTFRKTLADKDAQGWKASVPAGG